MRITPLDIRRQEFKKSMRGFDPDEVSAFLNTVAEEYEAALNDNKGLREHIVNLKARVDEFKSMETNLRNTLLTAQQLTSDAKENARHEAGLILREAEVEAEKASENIRSHTRQLRREILELKKQKDNYLTRLKTLIENHREMINGFEDDFAQSDQEIENLESRIKEDSRKSVQHRRMSREKITEKFSRKLEEKRVEEENTEPRGEEAEGKSAPQGPLGAGEKDDLSPRTSDEERSLQSSAEADFSNPENPAAEADGDMDIIEARLNNLNRDEFQQNSDEADSAENEDVEGENSESDQWDNYEVRKKETDWKNYEISSEDNSAEDGVEEALSGLTEESGQSEHESAGRDDKEGLSAYAEEESAEAESGVDETRDNPQGQGRQQSEGYEMKQESKETGEENSGEQPENGLNSEEEADEDGTWSMDRLKENVTNIGKQDS
ncbi:MAG: DivIVA domain-containing protein [Candidatus Krumholzibacteriota bacterium]|nr:DivIVA domain-containing protein [Candidatus Krumholzibacteriota bacterium]